MTTHTGTTTHAEMLDQSAAAPVRLQFSPQRWWLALLLHFAMLFLFVHRGALSVAAPFMMEELGLSTAVMGVLL